MVATSGATIVCLQETKIAVWTTKLIRDTLGPNFVNKYITLPAIGVRGGILLAANEQFFSLQNPHTTTHTVSADIVMRVDKIIWAVTGVYGPQDTNEKELFLDEIKGLKTRAKKEWLILGDFNLIYKVEDKSGNRLNRRLMTRFKETLDNAQLMEVDLRGRAYTWSNEQNDPTFTRIDRFFGSPEWHILFPNIHLQALSTSGSDHAPLLLTGDVTRQNYSRFRFESRAKQSKPLGLNQSILKIPSSGCMSN
jgi:exonuclease III